MLLAAPLERTLLSAGICSAQTQWGMKGWREEKTRTSPTPAMGEAWRCAGGNGRAGQGVGGILKVHVSNKGCLKQEDDSIQIRWMIVCKLPSIVKYDLFLEVNISWPETFHKLFSELMSHFSIVFRKTSQSLPLNCLQFVVLRFVLLQKLWFSFPVRALLASATLQIAATSATTPFPLLIPLSLFST